MSIEYTIYIPGQQWGFTLENVNENYSLNIDHHKRKDLSETVKAVDYPLTKLQYEIFLNSLFLPVMKVMEENREYKNAIDPLARLILKLPE